MCAECTVNYCWLQLNINRQDLLGSVRDIKVVTVVACIIIFFMLLIIHTQTAVMIKLINFPVSLFDVILGLLVKLLAGCRRYCVILKPDMPSINRHVVETTTVGRLGWCVCIHSFMIVLAIIVYARHVTKFLLLLHVIVNRGRWVSWIDNTLPGKRLIKLPFLSVVGLHLV